MQSSNENDLHFVVYAPNYLQSSDMQAKLKVFRNFNRVNTDRNFRHKYWIVDNA